MAQTHTDTSVNQLIINKLNKQEYDNLQQVSNTELYLVEEQVDSAVTQGSTNPVQSGAVYEALQDIGGNINDGTTTFTKNNETIGTTSANQENDKTIAIPNDVEMVYFAHSKALSVQTTDAYYDTNYNYLVEEDPATWTDPNPQHRITTDGYYYDLLTDNIYQVDNYETAEVTSNVTIQGDTNKLYCDVDTNKLYRYDGTNFVLLNAKTNEIVDNFIITKDETNNWYAYSSECIYIGLVERIDPPVFYDKATSSLHTFTSDDYNKYFYDYIDNKMYMCFRSGDSPTLYCISDVPLYNLENLDTTKTYISYGTNKIYRTNDGTEFKLIATNSYNDLSNKPLSVESSKVKYTLSDGTTKLTLAQESDLFSKDYNDLTSKPSKNYALGTNVPLITTEVGSKYYTFSSDLETGTQYKVIFDMIISSTLTFSTRNSIYIYVNQSFMWIVSSGTYQAGEYHIEKIVNVPNSFTNARIYLTANDSEFVGKVTVRNLRFENISENGWKPNISDEMVDFTSLAVSGNIASGETLAVMFKKINIALGQTNVSNDSWTFSEYITTSNMYGILYKTLGILIINGWFQLVGTDIPRYSRLFKLNGYTLASGYPTFFAEDLLNNERNSCKTRSGESGSNGYFLFVNRTIMSPDTYYEGLPTIINVYPES